MRQLRTMEDQVRTAASAGSGARRVISNHCRKQARVHPLAAVYEDWCGGLRTFLITLLSRERVIRGNPQPPWPRRFTV